MQKVWMIIVAAMTCGVFLAGPTPAVAQQDAPFCLRGSDSGTLDCSYQTLAQCQAAMKGASNTESCVPNPRRGQGNSGNAR